MIYLTKIVAAAAVASTAVSVISVQAKTARECVVWRVVDGGGAEGDGNGNGVCSCDAIGQKHSERRKN